MSQEEVIIRNYQPDDYPRICALWQATGLGGAHRGDNQFVIERTLASGGWLLVLEEHYTGAIIGAAWLTNDSRRLYLHHLGVLPSHQGRGFGTVLTNECLKIARDTKLQIKLEVDRDNAAAIAIYRKLAFVPLGNYEVFINRDTGE